MIGILSILLSILYCQYYTKYILKTINQGIKRMVGDEMDINIYDIDDFV